MTWRIYQHPSDLEGDNQVYNIDDDTSVETIAPPLDPQAQLQADLKAARDEVAEWQDRFLRKAAEFENFRKRAEKEKTESMMLARSSILYEFLPVADACERALASLGENQSVSGNLQQFQQGVELLYKQLIDTLHRIGVAPIETEGKPFDPHLHEALSREETTEAKEDTIVRELRKGYMLKDKLLRPAQVVVAVHPREKDKEEDKTS
jgi:molecular chaperone GrpE